MDKRKIIIDTDLGDDVDDMFAIVFAGLIDDIDVIGLTTVFRNAYQRAQMAQYLLRQVKMNIPVYAGIDKPFIQEYEDFGNTFNWEIKDGIYQLPQILPEMKEEKISDKNAIDFIIESAEKYGEELTILAIGPMTNIATAIKKAPETMKKIKEIRLIGGAYSFEVDEWNVVCDPEALRIIVKSGIPIKAVGVDLTVKTPLSDEQVANIKRFNGRVECINKMVEKWFNFFHFERPVMHDSLIVATLLDDKIVEFEKRNILVCLDGVDRAKTKVLSEPTLHSAEMEVGLKVDAELFFKYFNRTFDYLNTLCE